MPKRKKQPKDMTTDEIAKAVFHPKLRHKLDDKIKEIDKDEKPKSDSKPPS